MDDYYNRLAAASMRRMARRAREAGIRVLRRELAGKTRVAFRPLQREIRVEAAATLPHRGGYATIMSRAVKVAVTRKGYDVYATIYARGWTELRDVYRVNLGQLRHPVWGHRKRKWATTSVRPGFVTRPVNRLEDRIVREDLRALDEIVITILRA